MGYVGDYKVTKVLRMKSDDSGFGMVPIEEAIAAEEDPHDKSEMERDRDTILSIEEDGSLFFHMPIPEGVPEEEIKKAEEAGMVVNGQIAVERIPGKEENGDFFMQDASKFLTGEEWVKMNTENPGELTMIMKLYQKID